MRRSASILVVGIVAALAGPGAAEPCTDALLPLRAEIAVRAGYVSRPSTPDERAEKRDLARALRLVDRRTGTFRKDAKAAAALTGLLEARYPADATVGGLLDGALAGIRADLVLEREDLERTAGQFPGGPLRDRALEGAAEADGFLAAAEAAGDRPSRAGELEAAAAAMERAYRAVLGGADRRLRRTPGDAMHVHQGGALLWRADRVTAVYGRAAKTFTLEGVRARRPADDTVLTLTVANFFGRGTYQFGYGTGSYREFDFTRFGIVAGGTLTVTEWNSDEGTAAGTFSFTARGCLFDCSAYDITGGTFRLRHVKVL